MKSISYKLWISEPEQVGPPLCSLGWPSGEQHSAYLRCTQIVLCAKKDNDIQHCCQEGSSIR